MSNCNDQRITQLLLARNQKLQAEGYECLLRNCRNKVIGMLVHKGVREAEAVEVLYESIADFYESLIAERFEGRSSICTYLTSIAINKLKSKKDSTYSNTSIEDMIESQVQTPEKASVFMTEQIKKLSPDCQNLIVAYYYHNYKLVDLAEEKGIQYDAIKKRFQRCMKTLKSKYIIF